MELATSKQRKRSGKKAAEPGPPKPAAPLLAAEPPGCPDFAPPVTLTWTTVMGQKAKAKAVAATTKSTKRQLQMPAAVKGRAQSGPKHKGKSAKQLRLPAMAARTITVPKFYCYHCSRQNSNKIYPITKKWILWRTIYLIWINILQNKLNAIKNNFSYVNSELKRSWKVAGYKKDKFLSKNNVWLQGTLELPKFINHEISSERTKRRKTQKLRKNFF